MLIHWLWRYHYYIKLVPTIYVNRWGTKTYTNQYSVTDSTSALMGIDEPMSQAAQPSRWGARNVQVKEGELSGLPGVFLVYDFSPFLMKQTEQAWRHLKNLNMKINVAMQRFETLCGQYTTFDIFG